MIILKKRQPKPKEVCREECLTLPQLALLAGVSTRTLHRLRVSNEGPPEVRDRHEVLFPIVEVRKWILSVPVRLGKAA